MKNLKKVIMSLTILLSIILFTPSSAKAWMLNPTEYYKISYFGKIEDKDNNKTIYYNDSEKVVTQEADADNIDEIESEIHNGLFDFLSDNNAMISEWGGYLDEPERSSVFEFQGTKYTDYEKLEKAIDDYLETVDEYQALNDEEKEAYLVDVNETISINYSVNVTIPKRDVVTEIKLSNINTEKNAGEKPKFEATLENDGKTVALKSVQWTDSNFNSICGLKSVISDDCTYGDFTTFDANLKYTLALNIDVNDINKYKFSDDLNIYVDGKKFDGRFYLLENNSKLQVIIINDVYNSIIDKYAKEIKIEAADNTNEELNLVAYNISKMIAEKSLGFKKLKGISEDLYNQIIDAIGDGKTITIDLKVPEIDENKITDDTSKIKSLIGNDKIARYYNITLNVIIDGKEVGVITLLDNPITITLSIPSNIEKVKAGYARTYNIVRVHNGVAEELETITNTDGSLSFKTDRFSTYAITYKDVKTVSNPDTSDNIISYIIIGFISMIGMIVLILNKKSINQD